MESLTGTVWRTIVGLELLVIALIAASVLGTPAVGLQLASVTPVARESLVFQKSGPFENFYELQPGYQREPYIPPWLGYPLELRYNADGLNDRFDYAIPKPPSTFRIVTLGDSWTYGQFVSTRDNYSEMLEDLLNTEPDCRGQPAFEVLNLGVPSYDIAYAAERFRVRGAKYQPDLVLWLFIANDFEEINEYVLPRSREYMRGQPQTVSAAGDLRYESGGQKWNPFTVPPSRLDIDAWQHAVQDQNQAYGGAEGVLRYQAAALRSIGQYYRNPLVLSVHTYFNLPERYRAFVRRFAASRPETYFYESPLAFHGDRVLPDQHPSPLGHRLIAEDFLGYLKVHRLVPCD